MKKISNRGLALITICALAPIAFFGIAFLSIKLHPSEVDNIIEDMQRDIAAEAADEITLKCPDDYTTSKDRNAGFQKFVDIYVEQHASASAVDILMARQDFYRRHGCAAALQRIEDYSSGNVSPQTKTMIEGVVDDYFGSSARFYDAAGLGFAFGYTASFSASGFPNDPEMIVIATDKYLRELGAGNKDADAEAIIITARPNDPNSTALDWLKGPSSGYDISIGYGKREIGGVDAYLLRWQGTSAIDGALIAAPDNTRIITVSILGDAKNKLLTDELKHILDTFSFK